MRQSQLVQIILMNIMLSDLERINDTNIPQMQKMMLMNGINNKKKGNFNIELELMSQLKQSIE